MKDLQFENNYGEGGVDTLVEERFDKAVDTQAEAVAGAAIAKQMEEAGIAEKIEVSSQKLEALAPQTPTEEAKKGFLLRIKSIFGGKELSPAEKIDKQLAEDIKALTYITTSNAGMGGLGNFSSGGFKGIGEIIKRYGLSEDEVSKVCKMQDEVENMNQGPEKVAMRKQLNTLKSAVTTQMYAAVERMKAGQ
jgi:hypothetical protein